MQGTGRTLPKIVRTERALELDLLPERLAVARLDPEDAIPSWALAATFYSISRTAAELSVVCSQTALPPSQEAQRDLRCLSVRGPLAFSETGILHALAGPLASAGISIFAVSTFDTDHLLVSERDLPRSIEVLSSAGHTVHR